MERVLQQYWFCQEYSLPLSSIRDNDYQMKPVILRQDIQQTEIALALTEPSAHPIVKLVPDF